MPFDCDFASTTAVLTFETFFRGCSVPAIGSVQMFCNYSVKIACVFISLWGCIIVTLLDRIIHFSWQFVLKLYKKIKNFRLYEKKKKIIKYSLECNKAEDATKLISRVHWIQCRLVKLFLFCSYQGRRFQVSWVNKTMAVLPRYYCWCFLPLWDAISSRWVSGCLEQRSPPASRGNTPTEGESLLLVKEEGSPNHLDI